MERHTRRTQGPNNHHHNHKHNNHHNHHNHNHNHHRARTLKVPHSSGLAYLVCLKRSPWMVNATCAARALLAAAESDGCAACCGMSGRPSPWLSLSSSTTVSTGWTRASGEGEVHVKHYGLRDLKRPQPGMRPEPLEEVPSRRQGSGGTWGSATSWWSTPWCRRWRNSWWKSFRCLWSTSHPRQQCFLQRQWWSLSLFHHLFQWWSILHPRQR